MKFIKSFIISSLVCLSIGTVLSFGLNNSQSKEEMSYKEVNQKVQVEKIEIQLKQNLKYPSLD